MSNSKSDQMDPYRTCHSQGRKSLAMIAAMGLLIVTGCGTPPAGVVGLLGLQGLLPGPFGLVGITGLVPGPAGPAGDPGPTGAAGPTGPTGPTGPMGDPGAMGAMGAMGVPGASPFALVGNDAIFTLGNVGIGTAGAPACKLDVNGGVCANTLQLRTAIVNGGVLKSDAAGNGTWQVDGLTLPFTAAQADAGNLFSLTNTDVGGAGLFAVNNAASAAAGLTGQTNGTGVGVIGIHSAATGTSAGVRGETNSQDANAVGVEGVVTSTTAGGFSAGVRGIHNGAAGGPEIGVYGSHAGSGWGVYGTSDNGIGAYGFSDSGGYGVLGLTISGTGVYGQSINGVSGDFSNGTPGSSADALVGRTIGTGRALRATNSGSGGVTALIEATSAANNAAALSVTHAGTGSGASITTSNAGNVSAALAIAQNGGGQGASITVSNANNASNVLSVSTNGIGGGISVNLSTVNNGDRGIYVNHDGVGPGVLADTFGGNALWGITQSISAAGVIGDNTFGESVVGRCSNGGAGVGAVVGRNDGPGGYGVRGFVTDPGGGIGVLGQAGFNGSVNNAGRFENLSAANTSDVLIASTNNAAAIVVHAISPGGAGTAGQFDGNVNVTGTLTKGAGAFRIDHPLDPENKYLYHSFVESPDMKNIYDGVVLLDTSGEATITLPNWFGALNEEFRYQLTAIGAPAPGLYIAQEVTNNQFRIAGGSAGLKVSWQVTGIRHDAYANAHRIPLEVNKPVAERSRYLHPADFAMPNEQRIGAEDEVSAYQRATIRPVSELDLPPAAPTREPAPEVTEPGSDPIAPTP